MPMMKWEKELAKNIRTVDQLKRCIKLNSREEKLLQQVVGIHPMNITRYYLSLINKRDKNDPIRKMIVPSARELDAAGEYDPSHERENTKTVGLMHKYDQTALILSTNRCAAYCRFCFRKRLVGLSNTEIVRRFDEAVRYVKAHKEINNVLISGGDVLSLPTRLIQKFLELLSPVKHLDFIRLGSRVPVTFPERILDDDSLIRLFREYSKPTRRIYIVTHFNHPKEITPTSTAAVDRLMSANTIVSNQAVLLKGVNDAPEVLAELMRKLVSIGVVPYYFFQCRPVKRVKHHFQVPLYRGVKIVEAAKKQLDGHAKRFRYVMSHRTGKVEVIGIIGDDMYFRYHQAKNPRNHGRFFKKKLNKKATWLDDFED